MLMRSLHTLLALATFFAFPVYGEERLAETAPLQVGDSVPVVSVTKVNGESVSLMELVSDKPAVLIFYRGGWCPYCTMHLSALMDIEKDLGEMGIQILAISPDKPAKLNAAREEHNLAYTLLSDSSAEAIRAFGLAFKVNAATRLLYKGYGIDLEKASGEDHHLLPVPAVFLVNRDGKIVFAHHDPNYKERLEPTAILEEARLLKGTGK